MTIKLITFDLDDTLMPQETSVMEALAETCRLAAERCRCDTEELVGVVCAVADRVWREVGYSDHVDQLGIAWWEGLWGRFDDGLEGLPRQALSVAARPPR